MISQRVHTPGSKALSSSKIRDYAQFTKLRLATLVVFSAFLSYWYGAAVFSWMEVLWLILGGFLITGASNGINQLLERDLDKLMNRTTDRPLPGGRMGVQEGWLVSFIIGAAGIVVLWVGLNQLSGLLGCLALLMYTALYTPMKRISPIAVFIGAFPGAIPPMLGYVAATGEFGLIPGLLFAIQFVWQFPHFWAIAWKLDDDYARAGFRLLPSPGGKNLSSAFQILIYSLFLIPISLLPVVFGAMSYLAAGVAVVAGTWFAWKAVRLFNSNSDKDATRLMFASFIYLPVVQLSWVLDKLIF